MKAAAEATTKSDAARLRQKCGQLITLAERLKTAQRSSPYSRPPSKPQSRQDAQQQSLLNKSSRLHGNYFPPWNSTPTDDEFALQPGAESFTYGSHNQVKLAGSLTWPSDDAVLTLSPKQSATFGGWKTLRELYPGSGQCDGESFMEFVNGCDLVQDLTTDCSVVASLCAAMRILTGRNLVRDPLNHCLAFVTSWPY